jgi:hypothetical protein
MVLQPIEFAKKIGPEISEEKVTHDGFPPSFAPRHARIGSASEHVPKISSPLSISRAPLGWKQKFFGLFRVAWRTHCFSAETVFVGVGNAFGPPFRGSARVREGRTEKPASPRFNFPPIPRNLSCICDTEVRIRGCEASAFYRRQDGRGFRRDGALLARN